MLNCPQCGHTIMTDNFCDYCAMLLMEIPASRGSDKRSASVLDDFSSVCCSTIKEF